MIGDRLRGSVSGTGYVGSSGCYGRSLDYYDGDSGDEMRRWDGAKERPVLVSWIDFPWSHREGRVKLFEIRPPSFDWKGSLSNFLA